MAVSTECDIRHCTGFQAVYKGTVLKFGKIWDAHLKTGDGTEFQICSELLSKHSELFKGLFLIEDEESVVIPNMEPDILEDILTYICTGRLQLNTDNMTNLLVASDFLGLDFLVSKCREFVLENKNSRNIIGIFLKTFRIEGLDIEYKCRRFLLILFEKAVKHSLNDACDMSYEVLEFFLSHRSINVSGEPVIWSMIKAWVQYQPTDRMPLVPGLLRCLCIEEIDDELASDIVSSRIILNNKLYEDLGDPRVTLSYMSDQEKARTMVFYRNHCPHITDSRRLPRSVFFVAKGSSWEKDGAELFVSYDDSPDKWRSVGEIPFDPVKLLSIDSRVYLFKKSKYGGIESYSYYDLIENEINLSLHMPFSTFIFTHVVEASGKLYAVHDNYELSMNVHEKDEWIGLKPMQAMFTLEALSLDGLLYAIGMVGKSMVMQVYDTTSDAWRTAPSPSILRRHVAAVVFRRKIFLLGGIHVTPEESLSRKVEVYDPDLDEWTFYFDLPIAFHIVNAIVVKDRLFVYNRHTPSRVVCCWDGSEDWQVVDRQSSSLHVLSSCLFCSIEGVDVVGEVMKENKGLPAYYWLESGLDEEMGLKSFDR